jgi:uncharacterized protein
MKIRIEDIPEQGVDLDLSQYEDVLSDAIKSLDAPDDVEIDPVIDGSLRLIADESRVSAFGDIRAQIRLGCARCLERFTSVQDISISMVWNRGPAPEMSQSPYPDEDEDGIPYLEDDELDPGLTIIQEVLLSIPMKPLCREECPGLCPVCGEVSGSDECSTHQGGGLDTRWSKLKELKEKIKE